MTVEKRNKVEDDVEEVCEACGGNDDLDTGTGTWGYGGGEPIYRKCPDCHGDNEA